MANEEKEPEEEVVTKTGGMSTMKIVIAAVLVSSILSGAIVGVTLYLMSDDDTEQPAKEKNSDDAEGDEAEEDADEPAEEKQATGPVSYMRLDPNFVVSFSDQKLARFMQFSLQIVTRDKKLEDYVKQHMPAIRSNLFLLLNNQSAQRMMTREGKQELLIKIAEDINLSLDNLAGESGVEAAYFDTFVIQ